ncbi:hypothetical protein [Rhodopila globiformis]|uniref:Cytochrome b561 domain-containing protein n=1 Tax=Rhodopila globiformis TaxID=1071 RepID=A0A2S6NLI8_RHOGL|nr:hypothetical protein [Rhodopila globiformis]PPQ36300.1 hypothetical protein CCS01_05250 [Rhodopila globiformis]
MLHLLPLALVMVAAVALGLFLGWHYIRVGRRPGLSVVHLLLGAVAIEQLIVMVHQGTFNEPFAFNVIIVLGVALALGLLSTVVSNRGRRTGYIVAAHAAVGLAGFAMFLMWVSSAP